MGRQNMSEPLMSVNAAIFDTLVVVNRRFTNDYDIYAGRPGILGNPFSHLASTAAIHRVRSRDDAVKEYERYAWQRMQSDMEFRQALLACEGRRVACWCYPLNCHVMAIARLIARWKAERGEKL